MKTSYKILLITAGIMTALLITGLMILRQDFGSLSNTSIKYKEIILEPFNQVKTSQHWDITVTQGRTYSLRVLYDDPNDIVKYELTNNDSILNIGIDTANTNYTYADKASIQITAPRIKYFDIGDSSTLRLKAINIDSLSVHLGHASLLISEESAFEHFLFESLGSSSIEYIADPY